MTLNNVNQQLSANTTLSHYRIVSKLGAGGMGVVYLAEDTRLDRRVALKVLPSEFTQDTSRLRRFVREAKSASALNHPNIITVYDIGDSKAGCFIVMELVAGRTLRAVIDEDNSVETLLRLGSQIARALSAAHAAGIVHRDIKPDNIMVRDDGYLKVLDFGLARLRSETESDSETTLAQHTAPGTILGTVAYMSPEQARGQIAGLPSDIFALGIVSYELATGRHPFKADTLIGYLQAITLQTPPPLTSLKPEMPAALEALILRMLDKDATRRPTAVEVAQQLEEMERRSHTTRPRHGAGNAMLLPNDRPGATPADEGFWVAVLPFKSGGANADLEALAEGLSEEIVTGLSRFSYLRVVARSSTLRFRSQTADVRTVGKELGARYVMEGGLRQAGTKLRLAVQLVDATSGANLWAETYERTFSPESVFELEDELVPPIVSTVADMHGILPRSMSETVRLKGAQQLSPYEALLHSFGYNERFTPEALAEARACLERAVEQAPGNADCWAMLSLMYSNEYGHWDIQNSDSSEKALRAARTAVLAAPLHSLPYYALAQALYFRREFPAFRTAAERAISLNPMDGATAAFMGLLIAYSGDWERGCALADKALLLNPNLPGMYYYTAWHNAYRKKEYRAALDLALKLNTPNSFYQHAVLAMCYAQLGEMDAAHDSLQYMLAIKPDYGKVARQLHGKWIQPDLVEHLMEGLRKAGLEIAGEEKVSNPMPATEAADKLTVPGFGGRPAIAVLAFDNRSNDPEQEYFADGLAEDLITRLSLWRAFPVIARNSSFAFKGRAVDVRKVSAALGVRYLVQGSVRKTGNRARITAQLVDAISGQQVWAKTYDRDLIDVFSVQDEISEAIAASLVGDLQRAEHERAQRRAPENLEAWGLYQRALPLLYRFTRESSAEARALLDRATALDPQFSSALARLAELGVWDFIFGWTDSPQQALEEALAQARHAVELDPRDAEAYSELAFALMTAGFGDEALEAAQRGLDLNPCMPFGLIVQGYLRNLAGNPPEESIELMERAMRLSPHDPTEFLFYDVLSAAYMNAGRYAEGLAAGRRLVVLLPSYYWGYLWSAMNAVGLGRLEEARTMIRDAQQVHPGLSLTLARQALGALAPEVDRRFFEALSKAGLEEEQEEKSKKTSAIRHTVGREAERDELRAAFNAAKTGRGSLRCVAGEPGIGKTTLVEDFLTELAAENQCTIARGRCSERLAGTEAYLPWLEALDAVLHDDPGRAASMRQIAPLWYAQVASPGSDDVEAQKLLSEIKAASQERMKRELAALLQTVAQDRPLVIFFDDLHWADVSTIDLLSFLAARFDALNVLIVTTYRPSDMLLAKHPFLQIKPDLQARGLCRELLLELLTEAEIAEYLLLAFPGHRFPAEFPKLIHAKTEGCPLFMADLLRYLRDLGVIAQTSGTWTLEQALPEIERELPESVRGMIERKIGQLSEEDRNLLTAASVQGYEFDSAVVAQVMHLEADEVEERLEKLERVHAFVKLTSETEFPNRTLTLKFRFVHVLYQNALFSELRVTRKASLSAAIAQSLLGFYGAQSHSVAGELANLFETARDFAMSAQQFAIAAQHAAQVFANAEALVLSRRGLDLLKTLPSGADRDRREVALQLTLGGALAATTFWAAPEVGAVHRRALELCRQQPGNPQYFQVLTGLSLHHVLRAEMKEAYELAVQLLQLAEEAQDSSMLEIAHCNLVHPLHHTGRFLAARKQYESSVTVSHPDRDLSYHHYIGDPTVAAAGDCARNAWMLGYPDRALRQARQACDLGDAQSNPTSLGLALHFLALVHQLRREEAACQERAEAVIALSRERDVADSIVWASIAHGWALARQGHHEDGLAQLRESIALCKSVGVEVALPQFLALMAEALCCAGHPEEALTTVEEALALARRNGNCYYDAELHRLRGELLPLNGAIEKEAEACFQKAIEIAQQQSAKSWELRAATSLARLWRQQGKTGDAQRMLAEIYGWFTEGFDTADLQDAKALLAELIA